MHMCVCSSYIETDLATDEMQVYRAVAKTDGMAYPTCEAWCEAIKIVMMSEINYYHYYEHKKNTPPL